MQPDNRRRRQVGVFEQLEERRVLASITLPTFSSSRPTVDQIGTINSSNPSDTYHINLAEPSSLRGILSGLLDDLNFSLKNDNGQEIASSRRAGTALESLSTAQLTSGHYRLTVEPQGSAQSSYRLTLSIVGGDDLQTGGPSLGLVWTGRANATAAGSLNGLADMQDYYHLHAVRGSPLRLSLSGLTTDVNLQVLTQTGVLITQGAAAKAAVEDVTFTPIYSGSFYIRVWSNARTPSNYRLDVTNRVNSDDLFVNPASLGTFSASRPSVSLRETLGSLDATHIDDQDYFRFAITSSTTVRINLSRRSDLMSFEVLDLLGRPIPYNSTSRESWEDITIPDLIAGRYVLHFFKPNPELSVSLVYKATIGLLAQSDDFPLNANYLGALSMATQRTVRVNGSVGGDTDVQDYFKFSLPAASQFSFSFTSSSAELSLQIERVQGGSAFNATTIDNILSTSAATFAFPSGTYLVRIVPLNRHLSSNYTFTFSIDEQGDDVEGRGNVLGMLIPTERPAVRATSTVGGPLDIQDCYRLNLQTAGDLHVMLSGLSSNLGIAILDTFGQVRNGQSLNSGIALESIYLSNLAAGTYYIRVYPELGAGESNYDLVVSLDGGDDVIPSASWLGILDPTTRPSVTFEGRVGRADIQDYFRTELAVDSSLHIELTGSTSVFQIQILTTDGVLISEARSGGTLGELAVDLSAGVYAIRVSNPTTNAAYRLVASVQ